MIIAAIPVKNNLKWTAPIVEQLLLGDEIDLLWVYDNGSTDDTRQWVTNRQNIDSRLIFIDASSMRFYDMWNNMIEMAQQYPNCKLAILNNDIRLPHMALKTMADNMKDYTISFIDKNRNSFQPVENVEAIAINEYWHRCGWAFIVDPSFWKDKGPAIDTRFNIWYGDDYLYRRTIELGGRVCMISGVGCDHAISQSHDQYSDSLVSAIAQDYSLFNSIWS